MIEEKLFNISIIIHCCKFWTLRVWNYPDLISPYWRIYWNDRPGWHITSRGKKTELGPDHLVVIAPETPFSAHGMQTSSQLFVHFTVDRPYETVKDQIRILPMNETINHAVSRLCRTDTYHDDPQWVAFSSYAYFLSYYALCNVPIEDIQVPQLSRATLTAMQFMQDSFESPVSNSDIAKKLHLSRNGFYRMFVKETGMPPQKWYTKKRIDYACQLLHNTKLSVDEIGEKSGFCDRAHFSHIFKKMRGLGPAEFRYHRRKGATDDVPEQE